MSKKTDYPRKYWWLILVVVPIVVAVIGLVAVIVPLFFKPTPTALPPGITITNNKFAGDMYFVTQVVNPSDVSKEQNAQQIVHAASSLVESKNYAGALSTLEQAAVEYPLPSIYNNLGVLYANQGDYQKAEQAYQSALRLDPNDQTANFNLGLLKQVQGKLDDAKNYLAKAPALQAPERTATLRTLAESPTQTVGLNSLLVEFTRSQNTITAKTRLINSTTRDIVIGSPTYGSHILDEATHKQYQVIDQSNNGSITVPANAAIEIWAKYTVPAEDKFQSLSVSFGDGILFERVVVK